jgi:hypothetical protein
MCLRFTLCTNQRVCVLNFLKKRRILCTLLAIHPYCMSLVVRRHHAMTCQQGVSENFFCNLQNWMLRSATRPNMKRIWKNAQKTQTHTRSKAKRMFGQ